MNNTHTNLFIKRLVRKNFLLNDFVQHNDEHAFEQEQKQQEYQFNYAGFSEAYENNYFDCYSLQHELIIQKVYNKIQHLLSTSIKALFILD